MPVRSTASTSVRCCGWRRAVSGGRWIGVALLEEADDEYLVVGGRELDADEAESVVGLIEGGV